MTECLCEAVEKLWNKENKTSDDVETLKLLVPDQYEKFIDYYDEGGIKHTVLQCVICGKKIEYSHEL